MMVNAFAFYKISRYYFICLFPIVDYKPGMIKKKKKKHEATAPP